MKATKIVVLLFCALAVLNVSLYLAGLIVHGRPVGPIQVVMPVVMGLGGIYVGWPLAKELLGKAFGTRSP